MNKHVKYLLEASVKALREAGEEGDSGYDGFISLAIKIEEFLSDISDSEVEDTQLT